MTYAFLSSDASVGAALRRVAREEADGALAAIARDGPLGPRVHEMRKAVKKLRGLIRLVRPVFREAAAENATLRDAGRGLSDLRDAAVQRATVERLAEGMDEDRREALVRPFREAEERQDAEAGEDALPAFGQAMEALRERADGWRVRREGWDAIGPGLTATWKAARASLEDAARDPGPGPVHEWRKRAKDHWYQARLLAPIWPEGTAAHVAAADDLGEALGRANDLAVLEVRLLAAPLDEALRAEALALATARYAEAVAAALPLGRRLFAERPKAMAARWGAWWDLRGAADWTPSEGPGQAPSASSMSATVSATP